MLVTSVFLLVTAIIIIIQVPAVQTKLTKYAVKLVSSKTQTRVEIQKIGISFPKLVVVKGLYLSDKEQDTLIYAAEVKMNLNLFHLLRKEIKINSFALEDAYFNINRRQTDSLFNFNFLLTAFSDTTGQAKVMPRNPPQWTFSLNQATLKDIRIMYDDEYGAMKGSLKLKHLKIKVKFIDLVHSLYGIDHLRVEGLSADAVITEKATAISAGINLLKLSDVEIDLHSDLKAKIGQLDLDDTSLAYLTPGSPGNKNTFDVSGLRYEHIMLTATDLSYANGKAEASVAKFSAVDQNNFAVKEFETVFSMDPHSITAKALKIRAGGSFIDADVNIHYSSLASLRDSIEYLILNLDMREVRIKTSDINYFVPQLNAPAYFRNPDNLTSLSGRLNGALSSLNGKDLIISTGTNTLLKTDFQIDGLPDVETAEFHFPNLTLQTGRQDIEMIAGNFMPENIELPEWIKSQISFAGRLKSFKSKIDLTSSFGPINLDAVMSPDDSYSGQVRITDFDLGGLLKNQETFGPVSLTAELAGRGFTKESISAVLEAEVSQLFCYNYNYHNLTIQGEVAGQEFKGKIDLDDENAKFALEGLVNLDPDRQQYVFRLNVPGADLKVLNLTGEDIQVSLNALGNLTGVKGQGLSGTAEINNIMVSHDGKRQVLDSFLFVAINEPKTDDVALNGALIGLTFNGTFLPADFPSAFIQFINHYFPFSDAGPSRNDGGLLAFDFEVRLHDHPILSEIMLPGLKEFMPGLIRGSFDEAKTELKLFAATKRLIYENAAINDFELTINSDANALNYSISSLALSTSQIKLDNFLMEGKLAEGTITANLSSNNEKLDQKLLIQALISKQDGNFRFTIDPENFFLFNKHWDLAPDHFIEIGEKGFLIHHFFMKDKESQINIASQNDQFNDDLNIMIRNFRLDDISQMMKQDSSLMKGNVNGDILLKRIDKTYGLIANAEISGLHVRGNPVGHLVVKTEIPAEGKIEFEATLSGTDNNLAAKGFYFIGGDDHSMNIDLAIESLAMKTVEAFSMGQVTEGSGALSGNLVIQGKPLAPEITGELTFNNAIFNPALLNSLITLRDETIRFNKNEMIFNSFTLIDVNANTAIIDGTIQMGQFKNFIFDLELNTVDFLLLNTTAKDNKVFNGRMIIDSKAGITGPMSHPVINARIKVKKGSNLTFAVPEDRLTTDKGEDVVEFTESHAIDPIMQRSGKTDVQRRSFKGLDIASIIEIDKEASLKLIMDPASTDSLVVKGEAALSFTIDRSGKMSLTGTYNLSEGSYLVTLQSVAKRKFDIIPGSTISWNGDPVEAEISINATYSVRASPFDLVAGQMSGLSEADMGGYKNRYPFLVFLKLRGPILHPQMSFEIQLPPEDKGILGGVVNQKLILLNEDQSALNKQVFALLVLGRFIQENPLETESGGTSTLVRSTVGSILSSELNQFSSKLFPGMDLNFEIQSYNDYQTGQAEGRTQVEVGFKKQLFNERLSIQLGGTLDVEGEKAKQNSASDITSDATVEFKLTKDGRYRLKAFRHNQYAGVMEGQLVETGAGVLYLRDFNKWKELLFRPPKKGASKNTE